MRRHFWSGIGSVSGHFHELFAAAGRRGRLPARGVRRGPRWTTLRFEPLEMRQLLAGDLVVINEVMYHHRRDPVPLVSDSADEEWIELFNRSDQIGRAHV